MLMGFSEAEFSFVLPVKLFGQSINKVIKHFFAHNALLEISVFYPPL
jgi:hypothetical protein